MIKVGIMSDIHNEFARNGQGVLKDVPTDIDLMIIAGDLDNSPTRALDWIRDSFPPEVHVVYVPGNHEYYGHNIQEIDRQLVIESKHKDRSIQFLNPGGFVFWNPETPEDKTAVFGATTWTDFRLFGEAKSVESENNALFRMNDFRQIGYENDSFNIHAWKELHNKHRQALEYFLRNDKFEKHGIKRKVVVTHHAPSIKSIHGRYLNDDITPAYASNLEDLILECGPDLWIHGHCHHSNDYIVGNTRVVSNPRGYFRYEENPDFDPKKVVILQ